MSNNQTTEVKYKKTSYTSFNKLFQAFERVNEESVYDIALRDRIGVIGTYNSHTNQITDLKISSSPEKLADLVDMLKGLYDKG